MSRSGEDMDPDVDAYASHKTRHRRKACTGVMAFCPEILQSEHRAVRSTIRGQKEDFPEKRQQKPTVELPREIEETHYVGPVLEGEIT